MPLLTNGIPHSTRADDVHNIYHASSVADIQSALQELSNRDAVVTSRLDSLLASHHDVDRQLTRLDVARAHLGSQVVATRTISHGMLSHAASTAHRISAAVQQLDQEHAAVKSTLAVVEQVAELKACVLGVHGSMGAAQDWETAADYLHRAFNIPPSVIDGAFAEQIVPTAEVPDPPRVTLDNAAESLRGLFVREFEKAESEGDGARITRFFKLFPLIGRGDVGLEAYGRYVCAGIAARARSNMSSTRGRDGMFYAQALTKLFEHIAQIVEGHQPLVERHYGPGSMTKVIERIQVEADRQGGLVLDSWSEDRRVHRRLTEIKSYPFNFFVQSFLPAQKSTLPGRTASPAPGSGRDSEDDSVDMKEIDALLNESAIMLGRWSLYTRFLAGKTHTYDHNVDDGLHLPSFLVHSTLQKKVSELLIEPFNAMATFFFRRSVEKSFQIDEPPTDLTLNPNKQLGSSPPFITSAVDDIMYIVNQLLQRTLSTSQLSIVRNVIPSVGRVLGTDFFGMEQRKMRDESYPKAAIQGALPPENLIVSFLVLINNLDVATDYVRRIIRTCLGQASAAAADAPNTQNSSSNESLLVDTFPFGKEHHMAETTLRGMEKNFADKTAVLINEAIEVMLKQVMRPRLRPVLVETFKNIEYDDDDDDDTSATPGGEDASSSSDNLVAQRFERGWQAFTVPIKRIATPNIYDKLLTATITHLARTLEKRLWSYYGRVNALGAVRLERDVAGIVATAVQGGKYALRDAFLRCTQMTLLMNMEDDEWEDVSKLGGAGLLDRETSVEWKLDADERKRVRAMVKDRPSEV